MLDLAALGIAFAVVVALAVVFWLVSLVRDDVSIVDTLWSLMFLVMTGVYIAFAESTGPRTVLVLILVAAWAIRLSAHIAVRNHGQPEDHRYQTIRRNNEPNFRFKSLYIVFGLQAALAGFISLPLIAAVSGTTPMGWVDAVGIGLWMVGMYFEVVGDSQLSQFKSDPFSRGKVLDTGLWRYTRHPNYFGECLLWWGFFVIALSAGGWWTILSPVLMTLLLLKVSGVALMEKNIGLRRPEYVEYARRTNAFIPGPPKKGLTELREEAS